MKKKFTVLSIAGLLLATCSFAQPPVWQESHISTKFSYSMASVKNTGKVYAYKDGELLVSDGTGSNWKAITTLPPMGGTTGLIFGYKKYLFMVDRSGFNARGIHRSEDGGLNWKQVNSGLLGLDTANIQGIVSINDDILLAIHDGSSVDKVFYSTDDGNSWNSGLSMFSQSAVSVFEDDGYVYLATSGTVYESANGGVSWTNLNSTQLPPFGLGQTIALSDHSFLTATDTTLYTSTDYGVTWVKKNFTGLPTLAYPVQLFKSPASDTLYMTSEEVLGGTFGLHYSVDNGTSWALCNIGLAGANGRLPWDGWGHNILIAHNGYMFASPSNHTNIYRSVSPVTTSTALGISNISKADLGLKLFPNPACNKLEVVIAKADFGNYTLKITDVMGRTVIIEHHSGNAQLNISGLEAGTYFVNISNGKSAITEPFIKE